MANRYEDSIKNLYQKLPAQRLSLEKRQQIWAGITEGLDGAEFQPGKRRFPKGLLAAVAAAFIAIIIFVPLIFLFSGGFTGATLEKTIQQSDYFSNDIILAKRKVNGGVLVFAQRTNAGNVQSSLNIRYVKKTIWGRWKVTKYGGGYGTSIIQAFYVFEGSGPGPLSTFYGEIKDSYVRKLKVLNQQGKSVPVSIFSIDHGKKRLWYAFVDPSKSKKFQIMGLGKDGKPITTKHYHIISHRSGSLGSTRAFTQTDAVKKIIAKHPDFPSEPNKTITVKKTMGGPEGSYHNVDLTTKVSKEGIKMYIVTFTKDWHVSVNGTDVQSVWKYRVKPGYVQTLKIDNRDALVQTMK